MRPPYRFLIVEFVLHRDVHGDHSGALPNLVPQRRPVDKQAPHNCGRERWQVSEAPAKNHVHKHETHQKLCLQT